MTNIQTATKAATYPLKNALFKSEVVTDVIVDKSGRFFLVKHENGTVFSVYPRFFGGSCVFSGYSLSQPIRPNSRTGSNVSIVGNDEYFDEGYTLAEVMSTIEAGVRFVPHWFSEKDCEETKHQEWRTVRLDAWHRDWFQFKGERPTDREMVNSCIKQDRSYKNSYHLPVSLEFVEEMRDCVPPAFMGKKGPFYYIQVGEATDHAANKEGKVVEVYETYITATEQNELTEKYSEGQWYFMGVKPLLHHG